MVVLWWVEMGITAIIVAGGTWWLWWRLPKRVVESQRLKIRDPKARADIEDNFRKTVGQALGGIAVLIGAGIAYYGTQQTLQVSQQASHDLLISEQVSKGFEQLGSEKVMVRLGGIYALRGVMIASAQYQIPILETLCAYVREGTKTNWGDQPSTDIGVVLDVIARRRDRNLAANLAVNLAYANIPGAGLFGANLSSARLNGVNMKQAFMVRANLTNTVLLGANLSGAVLLDANLTGAHLSGADLSGADLTRADLTGANFGRSDAIIILSNGTSPATNLTGANLSDAKISQSQLDEACGVEAKLPPGLTLKPCPPE